VYIVINVCNFITNIFIMIVINFCANVSIHSNCLQSNKFYVSYLLTRIDFTIMFFFLKTIFRVVEMLRFSHVWYVKRYTFSALVGVFGIFTVFWFYDPKTKMAKIVILLRMTWNVHTSLRRNSNRFWRFFNELQKTLILFYLSFFAVT